MSFKPDDLNRSPIKVLIILIPGNPGLCEFYDRFLNRLNHSLELNSISNQIICVGHLGLSLRYSNEDQKRYFKNLQNLLFNKKSSKVFAELDDQIKFHEEFLQMVSSTIDPKKTKLILIGHSLGGHIANKILIKHPDLIYHLISLYPTISNIRSSINGKGISPFLYPIILPIIHLGQILISFLIPNLILIFISLILNLMTKTTSDQKYLSSHSLEKTIEMIHNLNSTAATWVLGKSQMKEIEKLDEDCISSYKDKMTLFWTKEGEDWWIPKNEIDQIIRLMDSPQTFCQSTSDLHHPKEGFKNESRKVPRWERSDNNIPHAFCLEHGERMAEKCSNWIQSLLLES
ncbi:hypothetical protein DFH28DRAFT_10807 [Melampsora americana]|nr:hypothetical protein DFH28DRAFT_10807 [Melampsora americana]